MRIQNNLTPPLLLSSLTLAITLAGCATSKEPNDPWYGWNHGTQSFNDHVDKFVLKPLAQGYHYVTPELVDRGVTNLFSNIDDIGVTVNDMLQFKMLQSGMDASRFLINTTAGVVGLVDVASMIDLPKHDEDFGQTLGYWGIPSGPYLVLPFFGPSSPRDTLGRIGDALLNPLTYVSFIGSTASAITAGSKVVNIADDRADLMRTEKIVDEASVDRYEFIKNAYQQHREYLTNDGYSPSDDPDLEDDISAGSIDNSPSSTPPSQNSGHVLNLSAPEENNGAPGK